MNNLFLSCLAAIPLMAVTGCSGDREQPVSTTTTSEERTVSQPIQSATTTTETTVQKN